MYDDVPDKTPWLRGVRPGPGSSSEFTYLVEREKPSRAQRMSGMTLSVRLAIYFS